MARIPPEELERLKAEVSVEQLVVVELLREGAAEGLHGRGGRLLPAPIHFDAGDQAGS